MASEYLAQGGQWPRTPAEAKKRKGAGTIPRLSYLDPAPAGGGSWRVAGVSRSAAGLTATDIAALHEMQVRNTYYAILWKICERVSRPCPASNHAKHDCSKEYERHHRREHIQSRFDFHRCLLTCPPFRFGGKPIQPNGSAKSLADEVRTRGATAIGRR